MSEQAAAIGYTEQEIGEMDTQDLLRLYKETGDGSLKWPLVLRYEGLIKNAAMQIRGVYSSFAQIDDIINEGIITLLGAIDKFDPDKGVKFETYVSKRIRGMVIVYFSIKGMFHESAKYLYVDLKASASHLFSQGMGMIIKIGIAFIALAALDFMYQWWDYERGLRMSKQEIKEEYKQTEGDPQIKGKIKEMQRKRAQSRMMQQVPKADVVIRNPTHYAVALRYHPDEDAAPIVLAKGVDELALRIVRVAEEHHVPAIENVPLARALYADTELGQEIPPELYNPVAEVMVYIFRLNENHKLVK